VYRRYAAERDRDEVRWVERVLAETKAEDARKPTSMADLLAESERLAKYGERQSAKRGGHPSRPRLASVKHLKK
jgi:hypothetical protein